MHGVERHCCRIVQGELHLWRAGQDRHKGCGLRACGLQSLLQTVKQSPHWQPCVPLCWVVHSGHSTRGRVQSLGLVCVFQHIVQPRSHWPVCRSQYCRWQGLERTTPHATVTHVYTAVYTQLGQTHTMTLHRQRCLCWAARQHAHGTLAAAVNNPGPRGCAYLSISSLSLANSSSTWAPAAVGKD